MAPTDPQRRFHSRWSNAKPQHNKRGGQHKKRNRRYREARRAKNTRTPFVGRNRSERNSGWTTAASAPYNISPVRFHREDQHTMGQGWSHEREYVNRRAFANNAGKHFAPRNGEVSEVLAPVSTTPANTVGYDAIPTFSPPSMSSTGWGSNSQDSPGLYYPFFGSNSYQQGSKGLAGTVVIPQDHPGVSQGVPGGSQGSTRSNETYLSHHARVGNIVGNPISPVPQCTSGETNAGNTSPFSSVVSLENLKGEATCCSLRCRSNPEVSVSFGARLSNGVEEGRHMAKAIEEKQEASIRDAVSSNLHLGLIEYDPRQPSYSTTYSPEAPSYDPTTTFSYSLFAPPRDNGDPLDLPFDPTVLVAKQIQKNGASNNIATIAKGMQKESSLKRTEYNPENPSYGVGL